MNLLKRLLLRCGLLLFVTILLDGCSAGTRIAYNNLDTIVAWQLSDYVELEPPQKAAFKVSFQSLWDWHRKTQLPAYAKDLRAMAAAVEPGPPSTATVEIFIAKIETHGETLGNRAIDSLVSLLPMLSDAQVVQLLAKQRKDIDKDERKHVDETPMQRRTRYQERIAEASDRWIGDLNQAQKDQVDLVWTASLPILPTAAQRRQNRLDDLQHFADLLAARHAPDFAERLRKFSDDDPAQQTTPRGQAEAAIQARQKQLTIDILTTLDPAQRKRLREKFLALAEDCDALAPARPASEGSTQP